MKFTEGKARQFIGIILLIILSSLGCESKEDYERRKQAEENLLNKQKQFKEDLLNHLRKVINECIPIIKHCKFTNDYDAKIIGKILIWDIKEGNFSSSHKNIDPPKTLDDNITVIFILNKFRTQIGTYSISNQEAYRETIEYCLVYWPQKVPGGKFIISDNPPKERMVLSNSSRGSDQKLKDMIRDYYTSSGYVERKFDEKILELINKSRKE